jgi:DNA-binding CsgD family transcriptional regulator
MVRLVSNGLSNKEIAESLFISQFTVHAHLRNIFEKTGAKSRLALANLIQSAMEQSDWPVPQ